MIRICYEDFSAGTHGAAGLHGRVERCPRGVAVCLLPGLTAGQRRAVIRRLRQEASRGFGPPLPPRQLAIALGLDRVRTATRIIAAIVRLHPAVTLVPSACVVAMVALFVITAGGRPGIHPGAGGGLADGTGAGGGAARTRSPVWAARVTAADASARDALGATALGAAQRASDGPNSPGAVQGKDRR